MAHQQAYFVSAIQPLPIATNNSTRLYPFGSAKMNRQVLLPLFLQSVFNSVGVLSLSPAKDFVSHAYGTLKTYMMATH